MNADSRLPLRFGGSILAVFLTRPFQTIVLAGALAIHVASALLLEKLQGKKYARRR